MAASPEVAQDEDVSTVAATGQPAQAIVVNGSRSARSEVDSAVDLNNTQTDLIEVVTGGPSAGYGSDAVAGAADFVRMDRLESLFVRAQAAIAGESGNPREFVSVTGGTIFGADDIGNNSEWVLSDL